RTGADERCGQVTEQRVGEGEAVAVRVEGIGLPELERIGAHRVPGPGELPGLQQRVAQVSGDRGTRMHDALPVHRDGQQQRAEADEGPLVPQDPTYPTDRPPGPARYRLGCR